jgi:hypothetical protein
MSDWIDWKDTRPAAEGQGPYFHWWRVGPVANTGTAPEWIGKIAFCRMDYAEHEYWPEFSNWNGFHRTVPALTQWKPLTNADQELVARLLKQGVPDFCIKARTVIYPGIDLEKCPFCGRLPRVKFRPRYIGACVKDAEEFAIECCLPNVCRNTLPEAAVIWNRRA